MTISAHDITILQSAQIITSRLADDLSDQLPELHQNGKDAVGFEIITAGEAYNKAKRQIASATNASNCLLNILREATEDASVNSALGTLTFKGVDRPILSRTSDHFIVRNDYCGGSSYSLIKMFASGALRELKKAHTQAELTLPA